MAFKIDHLKNIEQNMAELLSTASIRPITPGEFSFGTPQIITPSEVNGQKNTQIEATYVGEIAEVGTQTTLYYNRNTLADSLTYVPGPIDIHDPDTLSTGIAKLAEVMNLQQQSVSINNLRDIPRKGRTMGAVVRTLPDNLFYQDSYKVAKLRKVADIDPEKYPLSLLLSGGDLVQDSTDIRNRVSNNLVTLSGNARIATALQGDEYRALAFDGTGDYVRIPEVDVGSILSGDFTIFARVYVPVGATTGLRAVIAQWADTSPATNGFALRLSNGTIEFVFAPHSTSAAMHVGGTVIAGRWNTIAITRTGNDFRVFLNGPMIGKVTSAATGTSIGVDYTLGSYLNAAGNFPSGSLTDFNGHMDQVTIAVGVSMFQTDATYVPFTLYSSAPAQYPFSLLLSGGDKPDASTDIRNLANDMPVTLLGNTKVSASMPSNSNNTLAFDGAGDYIRIPEASIPSIRSGDFTIMLRVWPTSITGIRSFIAQGSQQTIYSTRGFILRIDTGVLKFYWNNTLLLSGGTLPVSKWADVAVSRTGDVFRMFLNGTMTVKATSSAVDTAPLPLDYVLGQYFNSSGNLPATSVTDFSGYMDQVGILPGVSLFTTDDAYVPSQIYDAQPNHFITVGGEEAFVDETFFLTGQGLPNNSTDLRNLITGQAVTRFGDVKAFNGQVKYGSGAIYFDGAGDYISFPQSSIGSITTGCDFCIRMWFYPTTHTGARTLFAQWRQSTGFGGFLMYLNGTKFGLSWAAQDESNALWNSTVDYIQNQWNHLAYSKQGSTFRFFLNGVLVHTLTSAATRAPTGIDYSLGSYFNASGVFPASVHVPYAGYMDEVAVNVGRAVLTESFTPESLILRV